MTTKSVLAATLSFAVACGSESDSQNRVAASAATLPMTSADGSDCDPFETPTLCEWLTSFDEVVVGTIVAVDAVATPSVNSAGELVEDETLCEWISPGLSITLEVSERLHGSGGTNVTACVGHEQAQSWVPSPQISEEGSLEWMGSAGSDPFAVGSALGLALTRHPASERLSLLEQEAFTVDADGALVIPSSDRCGLYQFPAELAGATLEDFRSMADGCAAHTTYGDELRSIRTKVAEDPGSAYAGYCGENS